MNTIIKQHKQNFFFKTIIWLLVICFSSSLIAPQAAYAQGLFMPAPGVMVQPSTIFTPAIITGMHLDPVDPLKIEFLVDVGDEPLKEEAFKTESQKLINYFFAALTIPHQKEQLIDAMLSNGKVSFTSISQITASALIVEDYSTVVDHMYYSCK